jgi:multidrug resistance efflux pump
MQPFRLANLAGQVGGQIIELHPAITDVGAFKNGDVLARLDDSAERAALSQTQANIDGTRARLDLNEILLRRTESLRESGTASQAALDQVLSTREELAASLNSLNAARAI